MTLEPITDILLLVILWAVCQRLKEPVKHPEPARSAPLPIIEMAQERALEPTGPHAPFVEVVEDHDGEWKPVSRHEGGMSNHLHHSEIGAALRNPRMGVRWQDGHVERGQE